MIPGELLAAEGEIELNAGRPTCVVQVANTGDRPIQVGSHYHFAETNAALRFDRANSWFPQQQEGPSRFLPTPMIFQPSEVVR